MTCSLVRGAASLVIIRALNTKPHLELLAAPGRLESWKEIAAYLDRSERTVRRWESNEGLPVHRLQHDKRGSVYAYTRELDEWRNSRRQLVDGPQPVAPSWIDVWTRPRWTMAAVVLSVGAFVGVWLTTRVPATPSLPNPEAVLLVERASNFGSNAGRVQVETAIRTFQEAIRIDPGYARAWSGLATAYLATSWLGESPISETTGRARKAAEEALRLDASFGRPWRVLAFASHYVDYNHSTAEAQFQKAIEPSRRCGLAQLVW